MKYLIRFLVLALTSCISFAANAVSYNEATDGDLAYPSAPTFSFTGGVNTVTGVISQTGVFQVSESIDTDRFFFSIPTGFELTNLSLEVISVTHNTSATFSPGVLTYNSTFSQLISNIQLDASNSYGGLLPLATPGSVFTLSGGLPLSSGAYVTTIGAGYGGFPGTTVLDQSFSYKLSYDVTAVPEASTYAMMLAGLGLVAAVARRRKQPKA